MTSVYKIFNYILLKCLLYGYYHNDTSNISTFKEMELKNIEDKRTRQSISKWGLLKTRKVLNFKSVAVYMSIMLAHHILRILFFHIKNIKAKNKILEEKFMIHFVGLLQCLRSMQI